MKKFLTQTDFIVPVHYPRIVMETAVLLGADRAALLEGTGVSLALFDSVEGRLSYEQYAALIENALQLTSEPGLGLLVGQNLKARQMGVLALALVTRSTAGDAVAIWMRYARILSPAWEVSLSVQGATGIMTFREAIPRGRHLPFATEVLLCAIEAQGRALLGHPLPIQTVRFSYPRPTYAERYRQIQDVPMSFGHGDTQVAFDARVLNERIPFVDPALAKLADRYSAAQLAFDTQLEGLVARMRALLGAAVGTPPTLEELARTLQTSTRTLRRTLLTMGTSYRALLEETRNTRALELARSGDVTAESLARMLGFQNLRSFRRAFKRWTGHSPESFRDGPAA